MSTRRLGVGVAVLNGYLYAVGGSDGTSPLNTGLHYDIGVYLFFCAIFNPTHTLLSVLSKMLSQKFCCFINFRMFELCSL